MQPPSCSGMLCIHRPVLGCYAFTILFWDALRLPSCPEMLCPFLPFPHTDQSATEHKLPSPRCLADTRQKAIMCQLPHHYARNACKAQRAVRTASEHAAIFDAAGGSISWHACLKQALHLQQR
eukprot:scaffold81513_cov27-Tisochrysis_lutea.AAC.1